MSASTRDPASHETPDHAHQTPDHAHNTPGHRPVGPDRATEELTMATASIPAPGRPADRRRSRAAAVLDWARDRLNTTPGRLVLAAFLVVLGAVVCGAVAVSAERSRGQAAQAVRAQTEPVLAQAVTLYTALSGANATATATFLTGGLDPPARRAQYLTQLRTASDALATLTRDVGNSPGPRAAVVTVTEQLPVYAGLIESARANNRLGFPVGASYLRQASALLTTTMLPAAQYLYATEAGRLDDDYASGTATGALVAFGLSAAVALVLLLLTQVYVARISRRVFNVPMVLATIVLAGATAWGLVAMSGEQNALARAQRNGSDSVAALSAARVLLSRAQTDESLTLAGRGTDETDPTDFADVMRVLAPTRGGGGLLGDIQALEHRTNSDGAAREIAVDFAAYRAQANNILGLAQDGQAATANSEAVAAAADPNSPSDRLSAALTARTNAAQQRFATSASDATSSLTGLAVGIPLLIVLSALLAVLGLRQRLGEYR
jgi:hypothetical protein